MNTAITKFHNVTITTVWYDFKSGNWNVEYLLSDSITKSEVKEAYSFDRCFSTPNENAQFIADQMIKRLKEKFVIDV